MSTAERDRIIEVPSPYRVSRPDNKIRTWILLDDDKGQAVMLDRHWSNERGCTEGCDCQPRCQTHRVDLFVPSLQLVSEVNGVGQFQRSWEPVILHITELVARDLIVRLRLQNDEGSIRGVLVRLARAEARQANGRVIVHECKRCRLPDAPLFDVTTILSVRRITGPPNSDQVVTPARARRDLKPRLPLGKHN